MELIDLFAHGAVPVLGVCLGHQCIGQLLGCRVEPMSWPCHGRSSQIWHDGDGIFTGVPQGFAAGRYHSLAIRATTISSPLRVTAVTEDDVVMAVAHDSLPIYGLQFHPESVLTVLGRTLIRNFLDLSLAAAGMS